MALTDPVIQLANKYWAKELLQFDPSIINDVYCKEILGSDFAIKRIMLLEFSQYLENYLWPNYEKNCNHAHVMSIAIMINEKFRERVPAWDAFKAKPANFSHFFQKVLCSVLDDEVLLREKTCLLIFLIHCFNSCEVQLIRDSIKKIVSLGIWNFILPKRREQEFKKDTYLEKYWNKMQKNIKTLSEEEKQVINFERQFLFNLIQKFFLILKSIGNEDTTVDSSKDFLERVHYCEHFLELLIDLEALPLTRRFCNVLLDDSHVVVNCQLSNLNKITEGRLFSQLLDILKFYSRFEVNEYTGEPLSDNDMMRIHYALFTNVQRAAFKQFPDLKQFYLSNVASIDTRDKLKNVFDPLDNVTLHEIASFVNLLPKISNGEGIYDDKFILELLISKLERRDSQLDALNQMPLYPTEKVIWDENIVPSEYFSGDGCLALPKLNLQFLTLYDYLYRNFNLFRLESTYEIRQDIEDVIRRLRPWKTEVGDVMFGGWARMAQPISYFSIIEVGKPNIGEKQPSRVRADVTVTLSTKKEIKGEWEALRRHDVCFLVTVKPQKLPGTAYDSKEPFISQVGLTYIRGCEIEGMLGPTGKVIEEGPEPKPEIEGDKRTFRVWLDCNQYRLDMLNAVEGKEDVYKTFNIIMRRKPKENNFKAVLETIRSLMNTECVVPDWLHDIVLGHGDPGSAHYSKIPNQIHEFDFNDTFLNVDHLKSSFLNCEFEINGDNPEKIIPPFKIKFTLGDNDKRQLFVTPHVLPNRGPYLHEQPKRNSVEFTPTQVEAIHSGMKLGLTLVVGPPGTGKTDIAVQIISNLYHNFPNQRTLIVTHSNQALNQLFEKIMCLDIDERHLLRLGHGEEALETEKDFSRYGRVNFVLAKRLDLLNEVKKLQESLNVPGDVSYTCETAGHFYMYHILARWEEFLSAVKPYKNKEIYESIIGQCFPFQKFFQDAPLPLFEGKDYRHDMEVAEGCFHYIKKIFSQLEEFRAFELLRSGLDRSQYLLVKEAKIIAMTCTHAALKRKELVELGFTYDNILMEESAQILEIETFIPLLLQNPRDGFNRLKRWIMIGDHHQLPPVIKNMAFQKYSNMEQSLFTRFVRLGVPTIDLDAQGRSRPSICELYRWRYKNLQDLSHVLYTAEYQMANTGFWFDYQLINVEDFNGIGESEPNPYFYQNLAEAEYVVGVYMYMRLLGYPSDKISILTTYNGQKHLIRDVVNKRCADNPVFGRPSKVTTVDKYQGQQNDYILLSLVRTKAVGHLRDVRRLVVAMSRARLGLYIFARVSLFQNCFELAPSFRILMKRPQELYLHPNENYPAPRKEGDVVGEPFVVYDMPQMAKFVFDFYQQKLELVKMHMQAQR